MITPGTAELVLGVAKALIKFGGQLDRLLAEKVAVQSPLALKLPAVNFSPGPGVLKPKLRAYLQETSEEVPGPLGKKKRKELASLMSASSPDLATMRRFYALTFPDEALAEGNCIQPDDNFLQYLRETLPGMREVLPESAQSKNEEKQENYRAAMLAAAFYVDPGEDARQLGYPVRIGLLVIDVVSEFGAENTQLFVKDEGVRSIVKAVLERFASPDLESFDEWSPLLRHALSATLNGVLDARNVLQGANPWFEAVIGALADAREAAGENGDDYLLGLIQGKGYRLLLSQALAQAAEVLDENNAPIFHQIVADVLGAAAPLVGAKPKRFGVFFNEHWGDLMHAALVSIDKHGEALLEGESPLLKEVMLAAIEALAEAPGTKLLTRDTIYNLADAAISAVATNAELWKEDLDEEWLGELTASVVSTISNQGILKSFSKGGLNSIFRDATARFAEHPEWLVKDAGMFQTVVGGILTEVSNISALEANVLGSAAVEGALSSIAAHPELVGSEFAEVIASFSGQLAARVKEKSITAMAAADLVSAASKAVLLNPDLFGDASKGLPGIILGAVLQVAQENEKGLIRGETMTTLVQELFVVFARRGFEAASASAISTLQARLLEVLDAGMARAEIELGRRMDLTSLPAVLSGLVNGWLRGEISMIDPGSPIFKEQFAMLAEHATASR